MRHTVGAMKRPTIRYARTDDGVTIAYATVGKGPLTMVLAPGLVSQVEVAWEEPAFEHFMSRLAACGRVVMFDRRGTGLSDQATASGERLALPQLARDVEAVLDATGTDKAVVIGFSLGGMTAIRFAVDLPARTEAVIVFGTGAGLTRADDSRIGEDSSKAGLTAQSTGLDEPPIGGDLSKVDEWVDIASRIWGTGAQIEVFAPTMQGDTRFRAWVARLERHTCSPGMVAASLRRALSYDLRSVLADVVAPTLVLHRKDDRAVGVEHGRYLADHIPAATYVELDGEDHAFWVGDQQALLDAIITFLDDNVAQGTLGGLVRRAERRNGYGFGWDSLTPSEREVATLAAAGMTNKQVAQRLRMSPYTVDGRLRRVFTKLAVSSRAELAAEISRVAS